MRWRLLEWIKRLAETPRALSLSERLLLTEDRQFFLKLMRLILVVATVAIKPSLSIRVGINNLPGSIFQADLFFPKSSIGRDFANI